MWREKPGLLARSFINPGRVSLRYVRAGFAGSSQVSLLDFCAIQLILQFHLCARDKSQSWLVVNADVIPAR